MFQLSLISMNPFELLAYLLATALMCVMWVLLLTPLAYRFGLIDSPNDRKLHQGEVPLVGGVAIYLAILPTLLFYWTAPSKYTLLLAVTVLMVMGALDDRFHLNAKLRLAIQLVVVGLISHSETSVHYLGNLFGLGSIELQGIAAFILTAIFVLGTINSVNMADGLDGLAGGLVMVTVFSLIILTIWNNTNGVNLAVKLPVLCALLGALAGFIVFNFRHGLRSRAAIFLGDSGSMFLGTILVILMIRLSQVGDIVQIRPVTMIWVFGVPLLDLWMVIIRRIWQRRPVFEADHNHFHYLLLNRGMSPEVVVNRQLFAAILMAGIGVIGEIMLTPEWVMFYGFFLLLIWLVWYFRHD